MAAGTGAKRPDDMELLNRLRLIRSEGVGPRTFFSLLERCGDAGRALDFLGDFVWRSARKASDIASIEDVEREIEMASKAGTRFLMFDEDGYPETLAAIDDPPPILALRGSVQALQRPMVAIVGSRNASAAGLGFTTRLAKELGEAGFTVVSGFARGIDTGAHRASLKSGTVAVLAGDHARIYPSENVPLAEEIIAGGGAMVTEMPLDWQPRGQDFPRRNRIVSGLAYGVVVVEGALRSGSLITARLALEQGREVFAVPGSPLDPRAEGPNALIRDGATLCAATVDVVSVLEPLLGRAEFSPRKTVASGTGDLFSAMEQPKPATRSHAMPETAGRIEEPETGGDRQRILSLLGPVPVAVDALVRLSSMPLRSVQSQLLELEMEGKLVRHPGNAVSLT